MKKLALFLISIFTFLFVSTPALALESLPVLDNPNIITGERLVLDEPQYDQDTIIIAGQTDIDSTITGDAFIVSGQTTFSQDTSINQDLFIISGQQFISGKINQDVIIIGGEVTIEPETVIDGYLLIIGGQVTLSGTVKGSVNLFAGQVFVKDAAIIKGPLNIKGGEIDVSPDAQILGEKQIKVYEEWQEKISPDISEFPQTALKYAYYLRRAVSFYSFLTHLIVLLLLVGLFSKKISLLIKEVFKTPAASLVQGFMYLILTPFLGVVLITTIIGIPLATFTFFVYGMSIYLSSIFTALAIGAYIKEQKWSKINNEYLYGFIGLLILNLLFQVPLLKPLIKITSLIFGLSVFFVYIKQIFSKKK